MRSAFFFFSGDILLPDDILRAMQMQGSAERRKRAQILDSEGARQAEVNIAEGRRQATVLASEAVMLEKMNIAKGALAHTAKDTGGELTVLEPVPPGACR